MFLWVKRGRSTPYFLENRVFTCLCTRGMPVGQVGGRSESRRRNLLAGFAIVQAKSLIFSCSYEGVSKVIKGHPSDMPWGLWSAWAARWCIGWVDTSFEDLRWLVAALQTTRVKIESPTALNQVLTSSAGVKGLAGLFFPVLLAMVAYSSTCGAPNGSKRPSLA